MAGNPAHRGHDRVGNRPAVDRPFGADIDDFRAVSDGGGDSGAFKCSTTFLARSSWLASIPESSTSTMRGSERAAITESHPIFLWPHNSSRQGSLGNVARAARCQQCRSVATEGLKSIDVVM